MSSIGMTSRRDGPTDGYDRIMECLLVVALLFMPLAFGVVEAWSEEIVLLLTVALGTCFLLKLTLRPHLPFVWTWAYVPLVIFLAVLVAQLIPLPAAGVRFISPNTAEIKASLAADLTTGGGPPSVMTLSFYPCATRHDLRLGLAAVASFIVVLNVYRRSSQIRRLLGAVTAIGGCMAVLALLQNVAGNDKIYWLVASPHGTAHSGPFINHNHYAQFMNLSLGATLAFILVKVAQAFRGQKVTPALVADYFSSREARLVWAAAVVAVLEIASIFLSLSRGGMISTMLASAFMTLVLAWRKAARGSGWIMACVALGAFACVLYVGFDAVVDRLGTLGDLRHAQGGRWQVVRDVAVAWAQFPVLGTGAGSHEVVYPMFDHTMSPNLATHAENEYAQAAEEIGIVGLLALLAFGSVVWYSFARAVRISRRSIHAAAYGLGFGLFAILIHSMGDFGQHLPANMFLSVIFCALLVRLSHWEEQEGNAAPAEGVLAGRRARRRRALGLVAACVIVVAILPEADAARRAESHWRQGLRAERDLSEKAWQGSDEEYIYLLRHATNAQRLQPGNVTYAHWLNVYRWHAISRVTDPNTGEILVTPATAEFTERIVGELRKTLGMCPTFGPAWCVMGQLEKSILGQTQEGVQHVQRGYELAPCDPTACFLAGSVRAEEGDAEAAVACWRRTIQLDERFFEEVCSGCVRLLDRADLAQALAEGRTNRLVCLERILESSGDHSELLAEVRRDLLKLLEQETREPGAPAWEFAWLGQRYRADGQVDRAIQMYQRALAADYSQVTWRFLLAELLAKEGQVPQAVAELRTCLRLRPRFEAARRLLERLTADS